MTDAEYTQRGRGSDRSFAIDVTDEYEVDGETYTSSTVKAGAATPSVTNRAHRPYSKSSGRWGRRSSDGGARFARDLNLVGDKPGDRLERTLVRCGMVGVTV